MATRPSTVPPNAVLVQSDVRDIPGYDPELADVEQFQAQIMLMNRNASQWYAQGYQNTVENNSSRLAYHLTPMPLPAPPQLRVANVVWANESGDVHTTRESGDVAWIWETQ